MVFKKDVKNSRPFLFAVWQTAARPNKLSAPHTPQPVRTERFGGAPETVAPCGASKIAAPYMVHEISFNRLLCNKLNCLHPVGDDACDVPHRYAQYKLFAPHTPQPARTEHFGGASKIAAPCGASKIAAPYMVHEMSFNRLLRDAIRTFYTYSPKQNS